MRSAFLGGVVAAALALGCGGGSNATASDASVPIDARAADAYVALADAGTSIDGAKINGDAGACATSGDCACGSICAAGACVVDAMCTGSPCPTGWSCECTNGIQIIDGAKSTMEQYVPPGFNIPKAFYEKGAGNLVLRNYRLQNMVDQSCMQILPSSGSGAFTSVSLQCIDIQNVFRSPVGATNSLHIDMILTQDIGTTKTAVTWQDVHTSDGTPPMGWGGSYNLIKNVNLSTMTFRRFSDDGSMQIVLDTGGNIDEIVVEDSPNFHAYIQIVGGTLGKVTLINSPTTWTPPAGVPFTHTP